MLPELGWNVDLFNAAVVSWMGQEAVVFTILVVLGSYLAVRLVALLRWAGRFME